MQLAQAPDKLINELTTVFASSDEFATSSTLADLEAQARDCLTLDQDINSAWFDGVASALLSQTSLKCGDLQTEVLLLLTQWYFKQGEWEKGVALANKAVDIARRIHIPGDLWRALNCVGVFLSRKGDLPGAVRHYTDAFATADRIGDRVGKCSTLGNLAEARFRVGLLHESIILNTHLINLVANDPLLNPISATANHNIAVAGFSLSDLDVALTHIRAAAEIFPEPKSVFWANQRVILESTYARILVRLGRCEDARLRLARAKSSYPHLNSRPARLQIELSDVLCDAAEQRRELAQKKLEILRSEIPPYETAFRDLLEIELLCDQYLGLEGSPSIHRRKYLSHLAAWQRKSAICEVAAIQHSIRAPSAGPGCDSWHTSASPANDSRISDGPHRWERLDELAVLAELREDPSGQHAHRTGRLAYLVARKLGQDQRAAELIEAAARLHDIGKLAVPDVVLLKRTSLDENDLEVIRRHTIEGCQMLTDIIASGERNAGFRRTYAFESLELAAQIALQHHERWDGTGYPRRLRGQEIHEAARITAVCETFDRLTHPRPFKTSRTPHQSVSEIFSLADKQFDRHVTAALVAVIEERPDEYNNQLDEPGNEGRRRSYREANEMIQRILRSAAAPLPRSVGAKAIGLADQSL